MNNSPKVICRMVAHNSEKTIARAIESILNQTYKNLELHIGIRASTDSTADIANEYAKKDPRVRVIINKQAFEWDEGNDIKDYYHEYDVGNDYVCFMDGDDEYKPEFMEKMVEFAERNNLDIAACGFDVVDVNTGQVLRTQSSGTGAIIEGEMFDLTFRYYYFYMRTRWAKIYKISLMEKLDRNRIFWVYYCDDTVETLEYYRNAARVGIYPAAFYKWYYSGETMSFRWDNRRLASDRIAFDLAEQFLIDKVGKVSDINYESILCIYANAMRDTTEVIINADISLTEKLEALHNVYTSKHTKKLAAYEFLEHENMKVHEIDDSPRTDDNTDSIKQNPSYDIRKFQVATKAHTFLPVSNWISGNYEHFTDQKDVNMLIDIISVVDSIPEENV